MIRPSYTGFAAPGIALLAGVVFLIVLGSGPAPATGPVPSPTPNPAAVHAGGAR